MLAIRLQRTGRSGHSQFRLIVQDSRFSPAGGRVVAYLGSYDPHTKTAAIDSQKTSQYLSNGAQPSDSAARLLKKEGIKLPAWVKLDAPQSGQVRNPDKRRGTRPAEPAAPAADAPAETAESETATEETPAEQPAAEESAATESPAQTEAEETTAAEEKPAEDTES